jgi:hypothetical protein
MKERVDFDVNSEEVVASVEVNGEYDPAYETTYEEMIDPELIEVLRKAVIKKFDL